MRLTFGRLLLLFLVVPLIELVLLIRIGESLGFLPTVGLVVLTAFVGSWLARREGVSAFRRFQTRLASGALPGRELTDGLIILVSAVLLLTPGVLTDLVGLLGLLPPTRAFVRKRLEKRLQQAITSGRVGVFAGRPSAVPPTATPRPQPIQPLRHDGDIVEARVIEEDETSR